MHQVDRHIIENSDRQYGRFTRGQVRDASPNAHSLIMNRIRSGRWLRLTSRVLALPGAPMDRMGELWTAQLHFGTAATISHRSAAFVHGFTALEVSRATVTVPAGSHRRSAEFQVHQSDLTEDQQTNVHGLCVTSIARTIVDLAPAASVQRIDTWLDQMTAERLLHPQELADLAERLHSPAKNGLRPLISLVGDRLPGGGVSQGPLERQLTRVLRSTGLGVGVAQYPHPGRLGGGSLVDRAFPDARLIIEVDGRTWHDRKLASLTDRRRDRAAALVGWQTVRYLHEDLVRAPEAAAEEMARIHAIRLAERGTPQPGTVDPGVGSCGA